MSKLAFFDGLGIRQRVTLLALVPVILITLVLSVYMIGTRLSDERSALFERSETLAHYLAAGSEFAFFTGDTTSLASLARGLLDQEEINDVLFLSDRAGLLYRNAVGAPMFKMDPHARFLDRPYHQLEPGVWAFHAPVVATDLVIDDFREATPREERIGWVILVVNERAMQVRQGEILRRGVLITLGGLVLTLLMARLIGQSITRPVQEVVDTVNRLRQGALDARVEEGSQGELGELERGINSLAGRVQHTQERLQQEVREATRELQQTLSRVESQNQALQQARERAERANLAKDEFLARMSHELRTPLTSVLGFVRLLQQTPLDATQAEYGGIIQRTSTLLLALIDDILDFSKLQSDAILLEAIPFSLKECVEDVLKMQEPLAREKRVVLALESDSQLPEWVLGDPTRMRQVAANLVSNAVKFTDAGSVTVTVKARPQESHTLVELQVEDTGIGIAPEQQALLFAPFSQADTSITRRFGGSGLGLVITRRLVELMGGEVFLESQPGQGTRVTVRLRLAIPSAVPLSMPEPQNEAPPTQEPRLSRLCILVVEDNRFNRLLLQRMLEQQGARVCLAEDGEQALAAIEQGRFDLILMDIHMPVMDGIEASRRIRERPGAVGQTPIIALTANVVPSEAQQLQQVGVGCTLYKPIDEQLLLRRIQQWVYSPKAPAPAAVPAQDGGLPRLARYGISPLSLHTELKGQVDALYQGFVERDTAVMRDHSHQLMGLAGLLELVELEAAVRGFNRVVKEADTREHWRYLWRLTRVVNRLPLGEIENNEEVESAL